jgi:hypothetical protein
MRSTFQAPPVHLILRAYPPAPARLGLWQRPLAFRVLASVLSAALFWSVAPWSFWVPPHYPWPVLCFATGTYLAFWFSRRYRVRWFAGLCPRCGHGLELPSGTAINLPHSLTCFHCHFEPQLEAYTEAEEERLAVDERLNLRHVRSECTGTWSEIAPWRQPYLACTTCGARHHATPALRQAAEDENETGRLLEDLADEGRYLC